MKKDIDPSEEKITGEWIESGEDVVRDENCNRVIYLTENYLEELVVDSPNWEILYRDPKDGRFWVKTYPQSNLHGGGPPELEVISKEEARKRFEYS